MKLPCMWTDYFSFVAAAYTYYRTLTQNKSLQKRGKLEERNTVRRRKERTNRVSATYL